MIDKELLLDELREIVADCVFSDSLEETLNDMPQFLSHYLREMRDNMELKYPHRKDIISKVYGHVISDMSNEKNWLFDAMKKQNN